MLLFFSQAASQIQGDFLPYHEQNLDTTVFSFLPKCVNHKLQGLLCIMCRSCLTLFYRLFSESFLVGFLVSL